MSVPSLTDHASALREAALAYVWRQWRAVGAMVTEPTPARAIVDPEVLVLMSLWLLEHERRLADVLWSWTRVNSSLISMQRLLNLRSAFPEEVGQRLSGLADLHLREAKDHRWKSLRDANPATLGERGGKARAVHPNFHSWSTLMLQFRLGLGVAVKADVLTFLLGTHAHGAEWSSVAAVADALRYTPAAVRRAADDLARARFIQPLDTSQASQGAQRMYAGRPDRWAQLLVLSVDPPGWGYWRERFLFLVDVLTWLDREATKPTGAYARDVRAREILTEHGGTLRQDRLVDPMELAAADLNLEYLRSVSQKFIAWLGNHG